MSTYLIGCGGVGSWLAPALCRLQDPKNLILVDGDKLEKKNLDRQLFEAADIGQNKAMKLAHKYGCDYQPQWFSMGQFFLNAGDFLVVVVDNHPARNAALQECDSNGCEAIFAANETYSAEAFYYQREWRGTACDPRVYYPEIATDRAGDPMARAAGCTGEAQQANPQLASANFMAAALALKLITLWRHKAPKLEAAALAHLPYKLISNLTGQELFRVKDALAGDNNQERTNT